MASVSGCGSVSLLTNRNAFLGSGLQHHAVFLKPWSPPSLLKSGSLVVEAKTKTSSEDRIARHSRIRKKVLPSTLHQLLYHLLKKVVTWTCFVRIVKKLDAFFEIELKNIDNVATVMNLYYE